MTRTDPLEQAADRGEQTRERIVQAARKLVVEHGYTGVSTGQVLERADVSRGGLYYHFSGKRELWGAVLEAVEIELIARLAAAIADAPDPLTAVRIGTQWYLDECMSSKELQRVGLHEGRQALGWKAWHEAIAPHCLAMLTATLDAAIEAGEVERGDADALAHLILALVHEAATMVLASDAPEEERARVGAAVERIIEGLRKR
jgi:AcrR family transcriptional regulator